MTRATRATPPVIYQIMVILKGRKPPIWRRMQVTSETTVAKLHRMLQHLMGWGYVDFLEAIRDPKHPEHKEMLEWRRSTGNSNASHHLKWGEGSDNFVDRWGFGRFLSSSLKALVSSKYIQLVLCRP
jgi:Plasmid pRiA4b ORF-3-like protein